MRCILGGIRERTLAVELVFDFTEQATRAQILNTILDAMDTEQQKRYDTFMEETSIPDQHHHDITEVRATIHSLVLPAKIKSDLLSVYNILVEAEARVHGCSVEEAHFHEVGNASGIRNALAICTGMYVLAPEVVKATSVQIGKGTIQCAHGLMDIPAPATKAIINTGIPVYKERLEGERCTPTSAALIKYFVQEFI